MKNKFVCVHGHFYQPPRESPWLDEVEEEPSAHPYHDWNARVFHECYGPNTASSVLGPDARVETLVNNFGLISFDLGPTLLSWLERHEPHAYAAILAADRASVSERGGHGNALAQAYNHTILPLASRRDKTTQVRWGLADFRHRFGREAEGMWLPECAVDDETLEVLAAEGVRFTVLAPRQAARIRPLGAPAPPQGAVEWTPVNEASLDCSRAYRWLSQERPGRWVDLFFYDGRASQAVAFEGLLHDGARFAKRLLEAFALRETPQLMHVATDGESYGHHHRWGNMALSSALRRLRADTQVRLTNYGEFLALFPPACEARVVQRSSWSCSHGVGRWNENCGCSTGGEPGWRQDWRGPLRAALDWLAGELDRLYEERARPLLRDPWAARDAYVQRLLGGPDPGLGGPDPGLGGRTAATHRFLAEQAARHLGPDEAEAALRLCELQRNRMLMYTSCGWFFSEVSGTEAVQVLKYAARAIDLAGLTLRLTLEREFQERLAKCPSNVAKYDNAAGVYARLVTPLRVDLARAAAHFAILDHFDGSPTPSPHYAYEVKRHPVRQLSRREGARERGLTLAHLELRHFLTLDHRGFATAVHHRGRLDAECWSKRASAEESREIEEELARAFEAGPEDEFVSRCDALLGPDRAGVDAVFADERRKLVAATIPGGTPEQQALARSWRATSRRLASDPGLLSTALRELAAAAAAGATPDRLPDAPLVRRRVAQAFWSYAEAGMPRAAELEAFVRLAAAAGLQLDRWELQAAYWRRRSRAEEPSREDERLGLALDFGPMSFVSAPAAR